MKTNTNNTFSLTNVHTVVVHPGPAHMDDFLSVCLALTKMDSTPFVERREPTEEELEDLSVLVLDCGRKHEPSKGNFDHHQLDRDAAPECAFSQLVDHMGLTKEFAVQPWFKTLVEMDSKGPFAVCGRLDIEMPLLMELSNPLANTLIKVFELQDELTSELVYIMKDIGERLVWDTCDFFDKYEEVEKEMKEVEIKSIGGVIITGHRSDEELNTINDVLNNMRQFQGKTWGFSITQTSKQRAENSFNLFRFNDHASVDFSVLNGKVEFAHVGGFFAQVEDKGMDNTLELVAASIS